MICEVFGVARSTFYVAYPMAAGGSEPGKRGPKTPYSDEEIIAAIREELDDPEFSGEGYKKIHARLRYGRGMVVGKNRVLGLMRKERLLAPVRRVHERGDRAHEGKITTEAPNEMWGTDGTRIWTQDDGYVWFFCAIDHCAGDVVGHHVVKRGDRFAALEPVRQGVRDYFGGISADVARGLKLRHDWGSQYTSDDFQGEIAFLGIESSPAFVGEPECNGVAERFMRTLREQCVYQYRFTNVAEVRRKIAEFIERYNRLWLLEKHGYRTPTQVRRQYTSQIAQVA